MKAKPASSSLTVDPFRPLRSIWLLFFVGVAAFFGFGLVAAFAYDAAKILFFVFLILAVIALVWGYRRGPLDV